MKHDWVNIGPGKVKTPNNDWVRAEDIDVLSNGTAIRFTLIGAGWNGYTFPGQYIVSQPFTILTEPKDIS